MADSDTRRYSLAELRAMRSRGETKTAPDAPAREVDADFWEKARLVSPERRKVHTGLRIDAEFTSCDTIHGLMAVLQSKDRVDEYGPVS